VTRFLVALGCLLWLPRALCAQADSTGPGLRLRFDQPPLALQQPAALRATWMGAPRLAPGVRLAAFDSTIAATREADEAARALGLRLRMLYGEPLAGAPDTAEAASQPRRSLLGLPTDYADLIRRGLLPGRVEDYLGTGISPRFGPLALYIKLQYAGRRETFCTHAVTRPQAAHTAKTIFMELHTLGWGATLKKRNPSRSPNQSPPWASS